MTRLLKGEASWKKMEERTTKYPKISYGQNRIDVNDKTKLKYIETV